MNNKIHDASDNHCKERSPKSIDRHHIPAPSLHHTHRSQLIGHVCTKSKECRFLQYVDQRRFHLYSWNDHKHEKHQNIEQIKCDSSRQVHISIEICRYIPLKCREDHKPDHDTIEDEKRHDSRDVGEDVGKHRKK